MTEAEWLASDSPLKMLAHLRGRGQTTTRTKAGRKKLRVFGCACARRVKRFMTGRGRRWLGLGEEYANTSKGPAKTEEIGATDSQRTDHQADSAAWFTLAKNVMVAARAAAESAGTTIEVDAWRRKADYRKAKAAEQKKQASLVRCLFGNPFRPVIFDTSWQTATVLSLAQAIYDERAFDRLPILADALEDAGCTNADVLNHCRAGGEHVRGCWVVDLVLGRE